MSLFANLLPHYIKRKIKAFQIKRATKNADIKGLFSHRTKQHLIYALQRKHKTPIFVETGTFLGEMVSAMRYFFKTIYSIELSPKLAQDAQSHFSSLKKIKIIEGDSAVELTKLLPHIEQPALFWLDGHFSGDNTAKGITECPIWDELAAINQFKHKTKSVILIDDARLFNGTNDYPQVAEITTWASNHLPNHTLEIKYDILAILPKT